MGRAVVTGGAVDAGVVAEEGGDGAGGVPVLAEGVGGEVGGTSLLAVACAYVIGTDVDCAALGGGEGRGAEVGVDLALDGVMVGLVGRLP